jgi:hypothetical protein
MTGHVLLLLLLLLLLLPCVFAAEPCMCRCLTCVHLVAEMRPVSCPPG